MPRGPDWDAIRRDYRTGKFTLRELEAKHGVANSSIQRKITQDKQKDPTLWQQDLTEAVRQATNARLMQELVSNEVSAGQQAVSVAVLAAAEVNANVIGKHRKRLQEITEAAEVAKARVLEMLASADKPSEVVALTGAIEGLARLTKTVIDKEREAHGITGDEKPDDATTCLQVEFVAAKHAEG